MTEGFLEELPYKSHDWTDTRRKVVAREEDVLISMCSLQYLTRMWNRRGKLKTRSICIPSIATVSLRAGGVPVNMENWLPLPSAGWTYLFFTASLSFLTSPLPSGLPSPSKSISCQMLTLGSATEGIQTRILSLWWWQTMQRERNREGWLSHNGGGGHCSQSFPFHKLPEASQANALLMGSSYYWSWHTLRST